MYGLILLNNPFLQVSSHQTQWGNSFAIEHFLFSQKSLSGQLFESHPLHPIFSEHKQHARPHLAIPSSRFMRHLHNSQFSLLS